MNKQTNKDPIFIQFYFFSPFVISLLVQNLLNSPSFDHLENSRLTLESGNVLLLPLLLKKKIKNNV